MSQPHPMVFPSPARRPAPDPDLAPDPGHPSGPNLVAPTGQNHSGQPGPDPVNGSGSILRSATRRAVPSTGARRAAALFALALAALLPGAALAADPAPPPDLAPDLAPVRSEIVTGTAERFRAFPGLIRAAREVNLAFLATGRIESRPVAVGDRVAAGQVIATLDQTSLAEDAAAARAAARAASAQAEIAAQAFERAEALHRRGIAPTSQLEAARAAQETSAAAAEAARATVTRAEDAASYARLTAPEAGIIIASLADPGATVQAGQPVATLALIEGREAVIDVPAGYLPLFTPESRFLVAPRNSAQAPVNGHLRLIEPVTDRGARLHRLRIALEEDGLRLGALVEVRHDGEGARLLTLPRAAIWQDGGGGAKVWRITPGSRVLEAVEIQPGAEIEGRVIIDKGIAEGDEILVRGIHTARAGQAVGQRIEE